MNRLPYEEIIKITDKNINKALFKFRYLKTEREDLKQELLIYIWKLYQKGKFDDFFDIGHLGVFVYRCCVNELLHICCREHRQGLWIKSFIQRNDDFELTDLVEFTDSEIMYLHDYYLERLRKKHKEYYETHKEEIIQQHKEYRKNNLEKCRAAERKYYHSESRKKYREKNKENRRKYMREYMREYQKKNRDKINENSRKRYKEKKEKENENNIKF